MIAKSTPHGTRVRTSTRIPKEDQDTGVVLDTNPESATGHEVLVGWDQGIKTWCDRASLFLDR